MAQNKAYEKSNEITAIPELLDMLDIEGCTISIDAVGYQKDIASFPHFIALYDALSRT